ncbi:hypothetical protein ABZY45_23770 [Streptomyces sp. NPDC006516]
MRPEFNLALPVGPMGAARRTPGFVLVRESALAAPGEYLTAP